MRRDSSAGASALARITTSRSARTRRQRRGFGPGEDHNRFPPGMNRWLIAAAPGLRPRRGSQPRNPRHAGLPHAGQRRGFGPGEDHNGWSPLVASQSQVAAPGLRPRRGSQLLQHRRPDHGRAGSAGASAPARITTRPPSPQTTARRWQRRGFGPGEDHNVTHRPVAAARGAAAGLRPRRGSQHPDHRQHAAARMLAAASVLLAG